MLVKVFSIHAEITCYAQLLFHSLKTSFTHLSYRQTETSNREYCSKTIYMFFLRMINITFILNFLGRMSSVTLEMRNFIYRQQMKEYSSLVITSVTFQWLWWKVNYFNSFEIHVSTDRFMNQMFCHGVIPFSLHHNNVIYNQVEAAEACRWSMIHSF